MPDNDDQSKGLTSIYNSQSMGFPASGFGSDPRLEIALTSKHFRNSDNHDKFNEFSASRPISNPGLGLSVNTGVDALGAPVRVEAGVYNNSYAKTSTYVAASWQPLMASLPGGLTAKFGGFAGVATGYTGHIPKQLEMGPFAPVVGARVSVEHETSGVALNASIIPGFKSDQATAVAFSLSRKF